MFGRDLEEDLGYDLGLLEEEDEVFKEVEKNVFTSRKMGKSKN